jgi:hypothetical protein
MTNSAHINNGNMGVMDILSALQNKVQAIEGRFYELGYDMRRVAQSEVRKKWVVLPQSETFFGLYSCLCIDTLDPWKQNRVRFYSPFLNEPDTPIKALDWAWPISAMGGFDDCGLNWVPPAGSTLLIGFERGSKSAPYYHGTTWHANRGNAEGARDFNYNIEEFYKIHEGHRKGYLVGLNDGSQVLPQWNTENYSGFDLDSPTDFESDPSFYNKMSYPNIYGFKTPGKHMCKMVDGNYKCYHRWKRLEILSGCGNWMIFKDDHMHPGGQWAHPSACSGSSSSGNSTGDVPYGSESCECVDDDGNPVEGTECNDGCQDTCENPYFKHENECRPYKGPETPQNNKCSLPQSGIQFLSISGHTFYMDDSVEQPRGIPEWERSADPFDFGCSDRFTGKTAWISTTGHKIEMNDWESDTNIRGYENDDNGNWIKLRSACGNIIELNDHTLEGEIAGEKRGVRIQSTSKHLIELSDGGNQRGLCAYS